MKKVFLHGSLGRRFKKEWEFDVDSPSEGVRALFASEPEIEKYLIEKEKEGVQYGARKENLKDFLSREDFHFKTKEDIHIFPVPKGSAGFALTLLTTVATTLASAWIGKKIAEALERDDETLQAQTKSYLYNGKDNRYDQGSTVPLGYGRLRVGSNVVSSCVSNYDYNSNEGKILNFNSGLYSLVPSYSDHYIGAVGPLGSALVLNAFDGRSQFRVVDPTTKYLQDNVQHESRFGVSQSLYNSAFKDAEEQVDRAVILGGFGGILEYELNFAKTIDVAKLTNYEEGDTKNHNEGAGNWAPTSKVAEPSNVQFDYSLSASDAENTSLVCVQSMPVLETNSEDVRFFPITFASEGDKLDYLPEQTRKPDANKMFPIQVGQRWRGGYKKGGVGWFKLESASVYKSIDLISEGPIEGFSDRDGETLTFSKTAETSPAINSRYPEDDYLQAVNLDGTPIKEILNKDAGEDSRQDAYNINEFDIDVGMSRGGQIGSNGQGLLEPQYLFTAITKDINKQLFGPRNSFKDTVIPQEIESFTPGKKYTVGAVVLYQGNNYKVIQPLDNKLVKGVDFKKDTIYYKETDGNNDLVEFFQAQSEFGKFERFDAKKVDYEENDLIKFTYVDLSSFYKATALISKYKGVFDAIEGEYSVGDHVWENSVIFKITGGEQGDPLSDRGERLFKTVEDGIVESPLEILVQQGLLKNLNEDTILTTNQTNWKKVSIVPGEEQFGVFAIFDIEKIKQNTRVLKGGEEYYLTHSVINPLVEEVYISLQVDELSYVYEGDEIEVTFKLGLLLGALLGALAGGYAASGLYKEGQGLMDDANAEVDAANFTDKLGIKKSILKYAKGADKKAAGVKDIVLGTFIGAGLGGLIGEEMEFSMGTKSENSGESWPNKAKFRIKYGNEGEIMYSTDVFIYGVATSPYRKDVKLYLPPNPQGKKRSIRVYKLNRELNPIIEGEMAFRYKEKMSLASVTEITPAILSYPNSVVIGTRVNARDVASLPTRTYDLKLKKVAIPSTYNPKTKRYNSETWNGLFIGQNSKDDKIPDSLKYWTDNPAWCLYDLLSNTRYGVGKFGIRAKDIDRWTLYRMAKYCDEEVPTGYSARYLRRKFTLVGEKTIEVEGITSVNFKEEFLYVGKKLALFYSHKQESIRIISLDIEANRITLEIDPAQESGECAVSIDYPLVEPRYTLNALLMSPQNAFKLINEVAQIFRAYAYWAGGIINFFQDEKKDSVMLFANNNISKEGFSYSSTPRTSRTNSCKVQYLDKYSDFISKIECSEDTQSIRDNNIIEQKIDGFGITSPGQAKRAADFLIKTAALETEMVSFETSVVGSYLRPGDIISVVDDKRTVGRFAGKVLNIDISGDGKMAEIDVDFPIRTIIDENDKSTWKNINLYSISGNQTIESLDSMGAVSDEDINNMRTSQVGQYLASNISNNDTRIKIINNPYSFVTGELSWVEALRDAEARGGILATANNSTDQSQIQSVLPSDSFAWLGGYYRELPAPEKFVWQQPQACTTDEITYFDWGEGFPNVGDPIETDLNSGVVTDVEEWSISSDSSGNGGNYIAVSGSETTSVHGDWVTLSGNTGIGYILEMKANNSLLSLDGIAGTTFSIDDSVNFSQPKTYRVININEKSRGGFTVQGVEYDKDKFENIENNASLQEPKSPVIFTEAKLDPPTEVSITASYSSLGYGLQASWRAVVGATRYRAQFFNGSELLATFEVQNNNKVELQTLSYNGKDIIEGQDYYVRIYPLTN